MASPLTSFLPGEVISNICRYLDTKSLSAFSLSNKNHRAIAFPTLFDTVTIYVWNHEGVEVEVGRWRALLEFQNCYRSVRTLRLMNGAPCSINGRNRPEYTYAVVPELSQLKHWSWHSLPTMISRNAQPGKYGEMQAEEAWKSVAHLVQQLTSLQRIVYNCSDILPHFIVDTMRRMQEKCVLDTLVWNRIPYESGNHWDSSMQLDVAAYSECLLIKVCSETLSAAYHSRYYRALWRLEKILQASTKAKEMCILWAVPKTVGFDLGSPTYEVAQEVLHEMGQSEHRHDTQLMSLKILHLCLVDGNPKDCLEFLARYIDFNTVETLKLEGPKVQQALVWLYESHIPFNSLGSLFVDFWNWNLPECDDHVLGRFLKRLKPLRTILLDGTIENFTYSAIIERHGDSLRELWLPSSLGTDQLDLLCTRVEVHHYKRLSRLSSLKHLNLILDTTKQNVNETAQYERANGASDKFHGWLEKEVPHALFRGCFTNGAVNRSLAQSIFEIISPTKPPNATRLDILVLETKCNTWGRFTLRLCRTGFSFATEFNKVFTLVRDSRDTHSSEIIVNTANRLSPADLYNPPLSEDSECICKRVFQSLWPETKANSESGRWWQSWHSFPLVEFNVSDDDTASQQECEELIFRGD